MPTYVSPFTGDVIQPTDVSFVEYVLTTSIQLVWPANLEQATDKVCARIMNISTVTAGLHIRMPPANNVSVGTDSLFNNTGAEDIDIQDYDGNSIVTVAAGKSEYIYITDNGTPAGTWSNIDFGATTANANAATLAGYGLLAISNTLNQSHPTQSINSGDTFASTDRAQTVIWSGGTGTATLPLASTLGNNWFTLFKNNGSGTFTIYTTSPNDIDTVSYKAFQPGESAFVICTGSDYVTVGYGQNTNFVFTALTKNVTGGSYTLTASEAANTIQEYVGTLTSSVTVYYPPVVSFYIIRNACVAGAFSLTVTTGVSGGAVATIPSGQQATLFCDGTNFFNANTTQAGASIYSLQNGSAGVPSLNFAAETDTGIYRGGAGKISWTILGNSIGYFDANGLTMLGTGTFQGGVSGGSF